MKFTELAKRMELHPDTLYALLQGKFLGKMRWFKDIIVLPKFKSSINISDKFGKFNMGGVYLFVNIPDDEAYSLIQEYQDFTSTMKSLVKDYKNIVVSDVYVNKEYAESMRDKYHMCFRGVVEKITFSGRSFKELMNLHITDISICNSKEDEEGDTITGNTWLKNGVLITPKSFREEDEDNDYMLTSGVVISFMALKPEFTPPYYNEALTEEVKIYFKKVSNFKIVDIPHRVQTYIASHLSYWKTQAKEQKEAFLKNKR